MEEPAGFPCPDNSRSSSVSDEESDAKLNKSEELELAKSEDRAVRYLSILCFVFLGAIALGVVFLVFIKFRQQEQNDFDNAFDVAAGKVISTVDSVVYARFMQIKNFANDITSHAEYVKKKTNVTWPSVTLPDFEFRAKETARLSDVISIFMFTKVEPETREAFINHTQEEKGWIEESIAFNTGVPIDELNFTYPLFDDIMKRNPATQESLPIQWEDFPHGSEYFAWQSYPMRKGATLLRPVPEGSGKGTAVEHVIATHQPVFLESFDFWDKSANTAANERRRIGFGEYLQFYDGLEYEEDPAMNAYYPVFDSLYGEDKKVVALLFVGIYWRSYFVNIFAPGTPAMHIVMENTCNQTYTYSVQGSNASFIGHGDLHEEAHSYKKRTYEITARPGDALDKRNAVCYYSIHVYPTTEMELFYITRGPLIFAISLASVFLLTSIVFLLYVFCVGKRQSKVLKSAQQSGSLVKNLFPEAVRERLYEEQEIKNQEQNKATWTKMSRLGVNDSQETNDTEYSSAIATLYPECSILFADLKGFTQWSSARTPSQVFDLLETIYGVFDKSARRKSVFKIETIGDCYVAATGLPHAQPDHALIMVKYGSNIIRKLRDLILTDLADRLGEDTYSLALRIGIHSGPVTAGVLRGDKGRFQVFGDTVNTASRLESNGEGDRIQVSEETAELLRSSGKGHWLTKRLDLVKAKGKGDLQCYWAQVVGSHTEDTMSTSFEGTFSSGTLEVP